MTDFISAARFDGYLDTSDLPRKRLGVAYFAPDGSRQTLDLYYPERGDGPFPVIINIASGAWYFGHPSSSHLGRQVRAAADRGYAFVSIACASSKDKKFPYQVQEVNCVLRYLMANAADLELDPGFIAFWSSSSGAHLSLLTALTQGEPFYDVPAPEGPCPRIAAVAALYPCCRLDATEEDYRAVGLEPAALRSGPRCAESIFLGVENVHDHPDLVRLSSPTHQLRAGAPPMMLLHGTGDDVLVYTLTLEFARHSREIIGPENVLTRFISDAGHSAPCFKGEAICGEVLDFMDRVRLGQTPCPPELQGFDDPIEL